MDVFYTQDEWPQRLTMENFLDLRELHADLWTVDDITGVLKESSRILLFISYKSRLYL